MKKLNNRNRLRLCVLGSCLLTTATTLHAQYLEGNTRAWGNIEYQDDPWVFNTSHPYFITEGLQNRHLSVWASHGRYYDNEKHTWKWQRPNLFCTTEDLFTQTIVIPYLIPMLQNAGAIVFTPRERDWQKHEVIVDNMMPSRATLMSRPSTARSGKRENNRALPPQRHSTPMARIHLRRGP